MNRSLLKIKNCSTTYDIYKHQFLPSVVATEVSGYVKLKTKNISRLSQVPQWT